MSYIIYTLKFLAGGLLLYLILLRLVPYKVNNKRFASSSVGLKDDKLDFHISADHVCDSLIKLNDYVNVVSLDGGFGSGKSSYARMIIESFDKKNVKILYSYISLTETNEAKDFSNLFAERWLETLKERYPKIDITSYLPFMYSILRESGHGFISDILKLISNLNKGLIETKARYFDKYYDNKDNIKYVSGNVAKIFGNIPNFGEEAWVIMIDEIERAKLDEIYRVIEIIERFKAEGQSGLPIKIIFFLCIAQGELRKLLDEIDVNENNNDIAIQIRRFFFENPKNITDPYFLPPVPYEVKKDYVVNQIKDLRLKVGIKKDGLEDLEPRYALNLIRPINDFLKDQKKSYDFIINLLIQESPRIIQRSIHAVEYFYPSFTTTEGRIKKKQIRFSDFLTLSYIKVRFPYLIDFFVRTIHEILPPPSEMHKLAREFDFSDDKNKVNNNKKTLLGQIEGTLDYKIPERDKEVVEDLISSIAYPYMDRINNVHEEKNKIYYTGTSSLSENLNDFLLHIADKTKTFYTDYSIIYSEHRRDYDYLENISKVEDLLNYSRFIRDYVSSAQPELYFSIAKKIYQDLSVGKIKIEPRSIGDTIYDSATYEFIFQIMETLRRGNIKSELLKTTTSLFKKILLDKKLNTGIKYIILNSFVNDERGQGSSIHQDLNKAFMEMIKEDEKGIRGAIEYVFEEAKQRYLYCKEVIYEKEENYFYVLFQGWSGEKDNKREIEDIRRVAMRDLKRYTDAIALYWDSYSYNKDWKDSDDYYESMHDFKEKHELYMPLKDLIKISLEADIDIELKNKIIFWRDKMLKDPRLSKTFEFKDDPSTLKAVLIRKNFLKQNKNMQLKNLSNKNLEDILSLEEKMYWQREKWQELWQREGKELFGNMIREYLKKLPDICFGVSNEMGELLGVMILNRVSEVEPIPYVHKPDDFLIGNGDIAYVSIFAVKKGEQELEIAEKLYYEAENVVRKAGCSKIAVVIYSSPIEEKILNKLCHKVEKENLQWEIYPNKFVNCKIYTKEI